LIPNIYDYIKRDEYSKGNIGYVYAKSYRYPNYNYGYP